LTPEILHRPLMVSGSFRIVSPFYHPINAEGANCFG
jgi:hypothetical protein